MCHLEQVIITKDYPMRLSAIALLAMVTSSLFAGESSCFFKEGDRVGFFGDSITEAKIYGRVTELVFHHFHPQAKVSFVNNGHGGLQLAGTTLGTVVAGDPNVVTMMIGMNDAIISSWVRGMPVEPVIAAYKAKLVALVRELKALGKEVIILTPTLTDESVTSIFMTEGTRRLLAAMGRACVEVAQQESLPCIDVQSEFERYEESLPRFAVLRPDGVHPCARGQYQIAHSLWTQLNLAGALQGGRAVASASPELDVELTLSSNIIPSDSNDVEFSLTTPTPTTATVTWSLGKFRGSESLALNGKTSWTIKLPANALPQSNGTSATMVVDVESHGARRIFIVDVFRKMVIHGKAGEATGAMADAQGEPLGTYLFRKDGRRLVIEASVKKKELFQSNEDNYPWGRGDALTLYLDLRKNSALAGLGFDGEVFQVWFKPQDKPFFSPGFLPYSGKHMANISTAYGERSADGYKVGLLLSGYVTLKEIFDVSDREFIGFDLSIISAAALGRQTWTNLQQTDRPNHLFPGTFALVDLYGKINTDTILTASVFP
jgi:lysophospholipase L1-like esterase